MATRKKTPRRAILAGAGAASLVGFTGFLKAHGVEAKKKLEGSYRLERDDDSGVVREQVHDGKGILTVRWYGWPEDFANPAILLTYDLPPGSSEGVHTHNIGDKKEGSYDEFYYIVSGRGEMEIEGKKVPVRAGDHIFTPNGVAHGIENTSDANMKVYIVAMTRT